MEFWCCMVGNNNKTQLVNFTSKTILQFYLVLYGAQSKKGKLWSFASLIAITTRSHQLHFVSLLYRVYLLNHFLKGGKIRWQKWNHFSSWLIVFIPCLSQNLLAMLLTKLNKKQNRNKFSIAVDSVADLSISDEMV